MTSKAERVRLILESLDPRHCERCARIKEMQRIVDGYRAQTRHLPMRWRILGFFGDKRSDGLSPLHGGYVAEDRTLGESILDVVVLHNQAVGTVRHRALPLSFVPFGRWTGRWLPPEEFIRIHQANVNNDFSDVGVLLDDGERQELETNATHDLGNWTGEVPPHGGNPAAKPGAGKPAPGEQRGSG